MNETGFYPKEWLDYIKNMINLVNNVFGNFKGKTILITGGTGSFGGMVLKKLLNSEVKQIKIFSRDEKKQDDLRKKLSLKR